MSNNKRPIKCYDIPSSFEKALPLATIPLNIKPGFRVTGIYPLNTKVFQGADFIPCFVIHRSTPTESNQLPQTPTHTFVSLTLDALGPVSSISPAITCTFDPYYPPRCWHKWHMQTKVIPNTRTCEAICKSRT
ncbi:hypothetical protein AVEN_185418-1 [Araneus ventricosus]|uniref:Uncharacterized protein n=1 Tax=Araneus ventricosus TaxID=182803 RepID=A0A4Y2CKV8_ARAVE|nr:hypothetical protein AVEN_185418-1 [Araneus ventricosus]